MRRISYPRSFYYVAGHAPAQLSAKAAGRLRWVKAWRALKDSGAAPAFARAAHSIKGIAATFCAVRLQQAAQQLEALGFDDNLGAADAWIEQLEAERPGLEAYLKGLAPS